MKIEQVSQVQTLNLGISGVTCLCSNHFQQSHLGRRGTVGTCPIRTEDTFLWETLLFIKPDQEKLVSRNGWDSYLQASCQQQQETQLNVTSSAACRVPSRIITQLPL